MIDRRHLMAGLPLVALAATTTHAAPPRFAFVTPWSKTGALPRPVHQTGRHGSTILWLDWPPATDLPGDAVFGLGFDLPGFRRGVAFWRYAPWKSWTKPVAMAQAHDLPGDDVQCAYWQYDDGSYGVALPLGGDGFRSTLGNRDGRLTTVCSALAPARAGHVPQVALAFGPDLFAVMTAVFADAMEALGTPENLRRHKTLPAALGYLGWNTWNASNQGHDLSAAWVEAQVATIKMSGAPIGTVVLDDGHFQARDNRLQSQTPDPVKFPGGFKPLVTALTGDHGIRHVGVWHAFDGYWNGIDPDSELGRKHAGQLFSWTQPPSPLDTSGTLVTYSFLTPDPAVLNPYFDAYYADLKAAGLSLVKVDNQLVAERMAAGHYPIWDLAKNLHGAINAAAARHFENALINCMDMTNDAFLNFGTTAVARSVEDYFPYKPDETYDLQAGNAAAHVLQAIYNALYFGEMVFPDFDMFESTNPNAALHASVRAANCAPIYVTDRAGQHDIALLRSLVDADGVTLRADTPLRPTADCLFQLQAPDLFKAWSRVGDGALLLVANLADADVVSGTYGPGDIPGLPRGDYIIYDYEQGGVSRGDWHEPSTMVIVGRFRHRLLRLAPVTAGRAVLGLKEKRNGLAAVRDVVHKAGRLTLAARDGGTLLIWCRTAPHHVTVDGENAPFTFADHLLHVPLSNGPRHYQVTVA